MSTEQTGDSTAHEVESRQVVDAPLRRSQEEAEHENPEVHGDPQDQPVSEEEVASFNEWEDNATE